MPCVSFEGSWNAVGHVTQSKMVPSETCVSFGGSGNAVGHVTQSKMVPSETLPTGLGRHPREDPFGVPFGKDHYPDRWEKAGSRLAGPYTFVLDGIQGDQDFVAALFSLKRTPADILQVNELFVFLA